MALRSSTKEKILDVAEGLFAEYGFNDTSLRTITSKAGVNLASVNYHFGDKKTLVRAVLNRYLEAFMPEMKQSLERLNERDDYDMAEVFEALRALAFVKRIAPQWHQPFYAADWPGLYRCAGPSPLVYYQSL